MLTDKEVRNTCPEEKIRRLWDEKVLYMEISPIQRPTFFQLNSVGRCIERSKILLLSYI